MRVNRLLDYARSVKGQFRLEHVEADDENPGQFFIRHQAIFEIDGARIRFNPDESIKIRATIDKDIDKMIRAEDWSASRDFVLGANRPPLIGSLLANARSLADHGNRRNALVEAVTALEVALSRYAQNADAGVLERFRPGLDAESVTRVIEKVGLRGSFGIAIPLLFTESEFPRDLLETCRGAIAQRNNVVHNGARDVDPNLLISFLNGIEASCQILRSHTRTVPAD